jgi:hypothetical protein
MRQKIIQRASRLSRVNQRQRGLKKGVACLRPEQQITMQKAELAERILKCAAQGERDRERLFDAALDDLAA